MEIAEIIANTPAGGTAVLPAGEFEGPVVIDRPLRLTGNNTTVWARHGSVIEITSPGVAIEGLRVEITEGELSENAITARCPADVRDIEVLGTVTGFGAEDGAAELPRTIALGELSASEDNTFRMTVDIPAPARILCRLSGVSFLPEELPAGRSEVTLTVRGSGVSALIYTELLIQSRFRRRIYLTGRFTSGAPAVQDRVLFSAQPVTRAAAGAAAAPARVPSAVTAVRKSSTDVITDVGAKPLPDAPLLHMTRGQRVPAGQYTGDRFSVYLTGEKLAPLDIDPYVFMLDENERSIGDGGFVFFGNELSPDEAVRYYPDDGHISVDLSMVSPRVKRITVAYSVYSGDSRKNFSLVRAPMMSLFAQDKERVQFPITDMTDEVTLVGMEFYIYKGEWRISAVGSGFRDGLVKLCNRYGIEVST